MKKIAVVLSCMIMAAITSCATSNEERDESNSPISKMITEEFNNDGSSKRKIVYEYDRMGNLISQKYYDTRLYCKKEYEYDDKGNNIIFDQYSIGEKFIYRTKYEYNDEGKIVKEQKYSDKEETTCISSLTYKYKKSDKYDFIRKYDENNNLVYKTSIYSYAGNDNTKNKIVYHTNYEYSDNKCKTSSTTNYIYEYDDNEKLISKTEYLGSGTWYHKDIYIYNKNKCTGYDIYDSNKEKTGYAKNTYYYYTNED